jgi:hypothetical protein
MQAGGRHPTMGTHNALLRLADQTYLEVLAIDPDAPAPSRPRWFGLDALAPDDLPRLTTWVARVDDIVTVAAASSEPLGEITSMERGPYAWRITIPPDGQPPLDGLVPALIEWSSEHPTLGLHDRGCRLETLEARHPDPERLRRALDAQGSGAVVVSATDPAEPPNLVATIETPGGLRLLGAAP